ncbi:phosphate/phosphite/phosphonate ABC transporter substrate-binding protein [Kaarinaea lacus]
MKFKWLIIILMAMLLLGCSDSKPPSQISATTVPQKLRVGFPPDENPQAIIAKNTSLVNYLKQQTGVQTTEIIVPETYTAAIEEMGRGNLDMVYFGGLTYVLAKKELDITPLVRGVVDGTPENYTFIVTRKDAGIKSLNDLAGRTFAFGDVASTSGHLIPHKALLNEGIDPNKDFKEVIYTGAHDKTGISVFKGEVDAGAMNARMFPQLVEKGLIKEEEMVILWKSEPFADYPWAASTNLGSDFLNKLTQAFENLKDPDMLSLLKVEGYQKTVDADFENIRKAAKSLGFMEE